MPKYPRPFYDRLRKPVSEAINEYSTPDSLPVPFFGDIFKAKIATISLNPGEKLGRLKNLNSLGAARRESLTDDQCKSAMEVMEKYFETRDSSADLGPFWHHLDRAIRGMGFGYGRGGGTVHLDLVQESTVLRWSALPKQVQAALWESDRDFLAWILTRFPLKVLVCNGKTTFKRVSGLVRDVRIRHSDALDRLTWYAGTGFLDQRVVGIVGWNHTLGRAGLRNDEEEALGRRLRDRLRSYGILSNRL
jgi:hypothetical protein